VKTTTENNSTSADVKYPRVWVYQNNLWSQAAVDAPVLYVELRPGACVRESTFLPDQLSADRVDVQQASNAADAA